MKVYNSTGEITSITTPVNKLKLFHSLSTKPMQQAPYRFNNQKSFNNFWYTAWSVLSAKQTFPNCQFNLHTDDLGARLLEDLPYDNIYTDLNTLDTHRNLFASAKFKALEVEELGAIHIDGDVILTNPLAAAMLNYEMNEVIVQNSEPTYQREITLIKPLIRNADVLFGKGSFCCGVIGINNQKLKDRYIDEYFKYAAVLKKNSNIIDTIMQCNPRVIFDLIFEQANLFRLCVEGKYPVKRLCKNVSEIFQLRHSGISHYIGSLKHKEENIARCKAAVKEMAPEIYTRLDVAEMEGI